MKSRCTPAQHNAMKSDAVNDEHPAFIANVCGTLIEMPAHDLSRQFAACPLCPIYFAKERR